MIRVILLTFLFLLGSSVMAQEEYLTLKCVDIFYTKTHNLGFVNKVICCRNEMNGDTLMVNQKIPITTVYDGFRIYDKGLLNGIFPRKNNVYIIVIQPINVSVITDLPYNYYAINCIFENDKSPRFYEITKNTNDKYLGSYQRYIDIDNKLYLIAHISKLYGDWRERKTYTYKN